MFVLTRNQAKAKSDTLRKYLAERGVALPASDLLNAVARMSGYEDWNAMAAQYSEKSVDTLLQDFEQEHAFDSVEGELRCEESGTKAWGPEWQIQTASGFWLVMPAESAVSYVRVCDPLGREVVYWSVDEFTEDAGIVLGALAGALNRGRSDIKPDPVNPSADKLVVADRSGRQAPTVVNRRLSELPWSDIVAVIVQHPGQTLENAPRYELRNQDEIDTDILDDIDDESAGDASDEQLEFLNSPGDDLVVDWGDEYEGEGLFISDLRQYKATPGKTWTLKDGRILRFVRYETV